MEITYASKSVKNKILENNTYSRIPNMAAAVFGLFIRKGVPFSLWEELAVLGTI
jgi:hypothetical protein